MSGKRPPYLLNLLNAYSGSSDKKHMQVGGLLKSFYFDCRIRNLTEKTITGYGETLTRFFNFLQKHNVDFLNISGLTIKEFIASLKDRSNSDHTINNRLRVLRLFFRYLVEEELLNGRPNPMGKIKLLKAENKLKLVLSPENIERVLKIPDKKTFTGYRNFCIIYTFYDTMIRLSELCNIKLSDLNIKEQIIKVYGKGRKERQVVVGKKLAKYLQLYLCRFREAILGEYLFCKADGSFLTPDRIEHIFALYSKKSGIHFNPHLIRHSAGTQWIKNNGNPLCLQNLMGHSSFRTTQKYIHLALEDLKKEHAVHSLGDSLDYR